MKDQDALLHQDHRKRMRGKYEQAKESLSDHELLEILLFSVIKRKNTNPLAHRLLKQFGSLKGVIEADTEALLSVEGVGEATAFFLHQLSYFFSRCQDKDTGGVLLDSITKIGDYLVRVYAGSRTESVYLLMLDNRARLIACQKLFDGTIASSEMNTRKIAEVALLHRAPRVILAHNHPLGSAEPSDDDVSTTRYLRRAFSMINLELEEHFIISENEYCPVLHYLQEQFHSK